MQLHYFAGSYISLHKHAKSISLSEQLTKTLQCLFRLSLD